VEKEMKYNILKDNSIIDIVEANSIEEAMDAAVDITDGVFDDVVLSDPEEQSKNQSLREEALKEQEDYKRLDKAVGNDWYHLGSDAFLGEWVPDKNQGFWGKAYDVGSYPLRLALGGYEGLAKSIYSGLESGAKGVQRVAEGKDLNYLEKEATNPINVMAAAAGPGASKLVCQSFLQEVRSQLVWQQVRKVLLKVVWRYLRLLPKIL
jgi:hypothetical protein